MLDTIIGYTKIPVRVFKKYFFINYIYIKNT